MHIAPISPFVAGAFLLAGCASKPENVMPSYVSPVMYQSLSCDQLAAEAQRVANQAAVLTGQQSKQRRQDTAATTAAIVIFWPAAFFVGGDDAKTAELARMKGEMQAIEQVSIQKQCGIQFAR